MTKVLLAVVMLAGAAWGQLPDGPGKDLTVAVCGKCHGTDVLGAHRQPREQWTDTMLKMIELGAAGTEDQFNTILQYLVQNFGPQPAAIHINKAPVAELAAGLGLTAKEAESIVTFRKDKGAFKSADELKKVPDLDFKKIEMAKDRIAFN